MTTALRLSDDLVREAEIEALIHKRSSPKQIEYWAQIGKVVARSASSSELLALLQGFAIVEVNALPTEPLDPDDVFAFVERSRTEGVLSAAVSDASVRYEASRTQPGLLDKVSPGGVREAGHFKDGEFTPLK
jgi:hypothetical protein